MIWLKIALNFVTLWVCFRTIVEGGLYLQTHALLRDSTFFTSLITASAALLTALAYFPT